MINTPKRQSYNPFKGDFDENLYSNCDYIVEKVCEYGCETLEEELHVADELYVSLFPESYPWGDSKWNDYSEAMACAFFDYYYEQLGELAPYSIGRLYDANSPILQDAIDTMRMSDIMEFVEVVDSERGNVIPSEIYATALKLAVKIAFCNEATALAYFTNPEDISTCYFPHFNDNDYEKLRHRYGIDHKMKLFGSTSSAFVSDINDSISVWQKYLLMPDDDDGLYISPIDKSLDYYETFRAVLDCLTAPIAGMVVFHKPSFSNDLIGKAIMFQHGRYCHMGEKMVNAIAAYIQSDCGLQRVELTTESTDTLEDYSIIGSVADYCNAFLTAMSIAESEIRPRSDRKTFIYEPSEIMVSSVSEDGDSVVTVQYDADSLFSGNTIEGIFDYIYAKVDLMPSLPAIQTANLSVLYNGVMDTFQRRPIEPLIEAVIKFGDDFEKKHKETVQQATMCFALPPELIEKICASHEVNGKIDILDDIYSSMDANSQNAINSVVDKIEKNLDRMVTVTVAYDSSDQKIRDLLGDVHSDDLRHLEVITIEFQSSDMKFNVKDKKRIRSIITKSLIEKNSYVVVTYSPEKKSSVVFLSCIQWDGINCNDQGLDASLGLLSTLQVEIPLNSERSGELSFDYIKLGNYE